MFGIGMVLAGGCVSGTYYRAAKGMMGSWFALIGFAAGASMISRRNTQRCKTHITPMGNKHFGRRGNTIQHPCSVFTEFLSQHSISYNTGYYHCNTNDMVPDARQEKPVSNWLDMAENRSYSRICIAGDHGIFHLSAFGTTGCQSYSLP